ncbi:MAG: alkaline phosphatase family protein [Actinomycetota bacterium]
MAPRLIVLGWDSATFDVVDPLIAEGRLPALSSLLERGWRAPLRSAWPAMTDCAWTCAFTGTNPGGHGIFGSWYRAPGAYEFRYFSSRDRRAPALWEMTEGVRHVIWNLPMAFPANPIEGAMVSGYGAPPGARFCEPDGFQDELARRWPLEDLLDRAPHSTLGRFRDDLLRGLRTQAEALVWALEREDADCLVAVWPHVDRAQHFFWRFRGTDHQLAGAIDDVYEAMDSATGAIIEAFPEADVLVISDHGAGTLYGDVNLGGWLVRNGFAAPAERSDLSLARLAWSFPPPLRRLAKRFAPGLARRTYSSTLAGQLASFDWSRTRVFYGVHSDVWLNLKGREPQGIVDPAEAPELLDQLREGLLGIVDPRTGARVFGGARTRAELYSGPASEMGPDLMLDSWSAGYRVAPGRTSSEEDVIPPAPLAGVNQPWSSDHRPLGIFAAAGPHIGRGASHELDLYDVCPTALALLELPVPAGLDGRAIDEAFDASWLATHPVQSTSAAGGRDAGGEFSEQEAAAVASHLRDLGYIE